MDDLTKVNLLLHYLGLLSMETDHLHRERVCDYLNAILCPDKEGGDK